MLCLPSGRIVDICVDRAKYHALRKPGAWSTASHRQLYALVDVIYRRRHEDGRPRPGWTEYDYYFSGHTIADVHGATNWSDEDKSAFFSWIEENKQFRHIESARRRLPENQASLSVKNNSSPRHLYSVLKKRLQNLPLQQASVQQWRATIENMRRSGLRREEIEWSGLYGYLSGYEPNQTLSRTDILAALNFDHIRLELSAERISGINGGLSFREVAQRMPHQAVYRAALKLDTSCHCILRYVDETYNYRIGVVKTLAYGHVMALNKYWFALDPYGRAIVDSDKGGRYFESSESAMNAADNDARKHLGLRHGTAFHTRYDHLTLFGGSHYREWLVTLPDHQRIFFGGHYYDHNVLAHIRTTTRQDDAGRRLLFIEEVQSDWHQAGQREGYDNSPWGRIAHAPFKNEWSLLAMKLMLIRASQNGFDGIAWAPGDIQQKRYTKSLQAIARLYDSVIPKALNGLGKTFGCQVSKTRIETRDPWLNLEKSQEKWRVVDGQGKFQTRAKYENRDDAMAVLFRHCRVMDLEVSAFLINRQLRQHIGDSGLPLFGTTCL